MLRPLALNGFIAIIAAVIFRNLQNKAGLGDLKVLHPAC